MKVLVVDDSAFARRRLARILTGLGFEAQEAADGLDALVALESGGPFGVIFLDWNMPRMDGLEVVRSLRRGTSHASTRVVFVTTENERASVAAALAAGADDYIMKPYTAEVVASKLAILGLGVGN